MPFPNMTGTIPASDEQLRIAAQAAAGLLLIDDARTFGLITGGPDIDRARCEEVIAAAAERGITVAVDEATGAGIHLITGWNSSEHPPERWEGSD